MLENNDKSDNLAAVIRPELYDGGREGVRHIEAAVAEAVGLARSIGLQVAVAESLKVNRPTPATLFGKGQVEAWGERITADGIALVVVDHPLSPVQQRNLERAWKCKVIDRTGLILEIFGDRAHTREGQLQVELAALNYQKSRLVRSWTHLERQRGGFGFMGGPGESQLEMDRRLITERITRLRKDLLQVRRTRGLQRGARQRAGTPTIALIGYTNAGKSTLFNRLTGAGVLAEDMLFATLDPHMRGMKLPDGREVILSDTVGFISDLPTQLVEAFRATLEEVQLADIILHVRDVSHPETREQKLAVEQVLEELEIGRDDPRLIEVLNKADLLPENERERMGIYAARSARESSMAQSYPALVGEERGAAAGTVMISALSGEGTDDLLRLLGEQLSALSHIHKFTLPLAEGAALAWLYAHGQVQHRRDSKSKAMLEIKLSAEDLGRFQHRFCELAKCTKL